MLIYRLLMPNSCFIIICEYKLSDYEKRIAGRFMEKKLGPHFEFEGATESRALTFSTYHIIQPAIGKTV